MTSSAPRIGPRLLAQIERIDDGKMPIAEVCRRVGVAAEGLGARRPSYEQIRVLVHERRQRAALPTTAEILLDVAARVRPPDAFLDHISGVGVSNLNTRRNRKRSK